jgi:hypothetical protein
MCVEDIDASDSVCPHCGHVLTVNPAVPPPRTLVSHRPLSPEFARPPTEGSPPQSPALVSSARQYAVPAALAAALAVALAVGFSERPTTASVPDRVPEAAVTAAPSPTPAMPRPSVPTPPAPPTPPSPPAPPPIVETLPVAAPPASAPETPSGGERLTPTSVAASSFIGNQRRRHAPERAFDDDPSTAWNESERGDGAGSWISATFTNPVRVQLIRIATGWDTISPRNGDLFPQNSHLRRVRITFDGDHAIERDVGVDQRILVVAGLQERVGTVRIEALDVWPGTRWADLCISEITLEGQAAPSSDEPRSAARRRSRRNPRSAAAAREW